MIDSYLIYGCHFGQHLVEIVNRTSNLQFFNRKIEELYNVSILELGGQYYLQLCLEQSDPQMMDVEKIKDVDVEKFYKVLEMFEMEKKPPYLISVAFQREFIS